MKFKHTTSVCPNHRPEVAGWLAFRQEQTDKHSTSVCPSHRPEAAGWLAFRQEQTDKYSTSVCPSLQAFRQAGWHSDSSKLISIVLLCAQVYKPSGRLAGTQTRAN